MNLHEIIQATDIYMHSESGTIWSGQEMLDHMDTCNEEDAIDLDSFTPMMIRNGEYVEWEA